MAIYNPPKQSSTGGILSATGDALISAGGIIGVTGAAAGGTGLVAGAVVSGVGAITKGIGSLVSSGEQRKQDEYEARYQSLLQGESNLRQFKQNSENTMALQGSSVINQSINNINAYMTPSGSGTGLVSKRLI